LVLQVVLGYPLISTALAPESPARRYKADDKCMFETIGNMSSGLAAIS